MNGSYRPFSPPRRTRDYRRESDALPLPPYALDSLATTISRHLPDEYVVVGEESYEDDRRYPVIAATTAYIEAVTAYRWDEDARRLRFRCPACALWDGKHAKGCTG